MKRIFAAALCLCLLMLCGCQSEPLPTVPPTFPSTESTEVTTEPTTVPTEPPVIYRNPLNGEVLEQPYTGRIVAVVINNLKDALPHHGVSGADIFYEAETEGGITRCLAVYSDLSNVESIGPVRSVRTFFNSLALSYNAPVVHCGGSVRGRNGYSDRNGGKIQGWEHLDQVYNGSYFFRDQQRYRNGYNWEHTLFTTGEELLRAMEEKGFATTDTQDFGLNFSERAELSGEAANKIVVHFRGSKTTTFTYDSATGLYGTEQYGSVYVDANTGDQMTFKNVMVLYTDQSFSHDGEYSRSYYELIGEGEGVLAIDGQLEKIKWSREALDQPFVYTTENGGPVIFAVGKTYIAIAGDTAAPVELQ